MTLLGISLVAALYSPPAARAQDNGQANDNYIEGWGKWVDPDGDCQHKLEEGKLTITVPNTAHDLSVEQGIMNAPMVVRDLVGDFTISVHVSGQFRPGKSLVQGRAAYQGAGLIMAQDNNNYIRLERACYVAQGTGKLVHYANFEIRSQGQPLQLGMPDLTLDPTLDTWLALQRKGNRIDAAVSQDGKHWKTLPPKQYGGPDQLTVGVAAVSATDRAFNPTFSDLNVKGGDQPTPHD